MKKWIFTFLISSFLSTPAWAGLSCGDGALELENDLAAQLLTSQEISITSVIGVKITSIQSRVAGISFSRSSSCVDRAWWINANVEVTFREDRQFCKQSFQVTANSIDKSEFKVDAASPIICR